MPCRYNSSSRGTLPRLLRFRAAVAGRGCASRRQAPRHRPAAKNLTHRPRCSPAGPSLSPTPQPPCSACPAARFSCCPRGHQLRCAVMSAAGASRCVTRTGCASSLVTPSGRSAGDQHWCCSRAECGDMARVHRNTITFDWSRRRWQLVARDRFRSHFRDGP